MNQSETLAANRQSLCDFNNSQLLKQAEDQISDECETIHEFSSSSSEEDSDQEGATFCNCKNVDELQPKLKIFIEKLQPINIRLQQRAEQLIRDAQIS